MKFIKRSDLSYITHAKKKQDMSTDNQIEALV
jgi:hypothetical protein